MHTHKHTYIAFTQTHIHSLHTQTHKDGKDALADTQEAFTIEKKLRTKPPFTSEEDPERGRSLWCLLLFTPDSLC